jgi:hypothetical protein
MIAYRVSATFPNSDVADEWLHWLREGHVAAVLAGGATSAEIVALDTPAHAYEVRYRFPSRETFEKYEREHAPRLRAEGLRRFPVEKGIQYRRCIGVVCDTFPRTA